MFQSLVTAHYEISQRLSFYGVILSAAVFQAERRISVHTKQWAGRFFAPLVKAPGFGIPPQFYLQIGPLPKVQRLDRIDRPRCNLDTRDSRISKPETPKPCHHYPDVSGIFCGGPLLTKSWTSTDVDEIRMTLYRRSTISPSPAMNTSSPLDRKILFGSPGWLAKPKNFSGIGGAAGIAGGV